MYHNSYNSLLLVTTKVIKDEDVNGNWLDQIRQNIKEKFANFCVFEQMNR